jgi:hypothetical protein
MNTAEDGLPLPQRYWAILNLAVGIALSVLDSAIANIALPAIAKEIHATAADSIWVINRAIISSAPRERSGGAGAIQATARLLGQTVGPALVALVFDYAGPTAGTSPAAAILVAAGFSAIATVISLSRLLRFVRMARSGRTADSVLPTAPRESASLHSPP